MTGKRTRDHMNEIEMEKGSGSRRCTDTRPKRSTPNNLDIMWEHRKYPF